MLRKSDAKVLMEMLPSYYHHLLAKYYGLGGEKVNFMNTALAREEVTTKCPYIEYCKCRTHTVR